MEEFKDFAKYIVYMESQGAHRAGLAKVRKKHTHKICPTRSHTLAFVNSCYSLKRKNQKLVFVRNSLIPTFGIIFLSQTVLINCCLLVITVPHVFNFITLQIKTDFL